MVDVYNFVTADGTLYGCGTALEHSYWTEQGVFVDVLLGDVLCQEPASEDESRKAEWGIN